MKVIILAAGKGTRLRPLTNNKPKCMVELEGKPLIKYQLDLFEKFGIKDIHIMTGYLQEKIDFKNIKKYFNQEFETTNMVYTLFCTKELFDESDDIIISYGDIIYNETTLTALLEANNKINVVVDMNWKEYWEARMENPLKDAETLKFDKKGFIKELGKKPNSFKDVEAQYIGLIKVRKDFTKDFLDFYENLDKNIIYDGKDYKNIYMTTLLQMVTDNLTPLNPVKIYNGWLEIDEPSDLKFIKFLN